MKINFLKGHTRTVNIKKNIMASFIMKGISILSSLLIVPLTIDYINPIQYGIWLTISSIIGWFGFFDLGFSHGFRNKFAEARATGDYKLAKTYVSTTYISLAILFFILWLGYFSTKGLISWSSLLNIDDIYDKEISRVFFLVFSFFCLRMVLNILSTLLIADQKPALSSFFEMLNQLLVLLTVFIVSKITVGSLSNLALILSIIPPFVLLIASFYFYTNKYRVFCPSFKYFQMDCVKGIFSMGGKFFLIQISWIFLFQCVNIILTRVQGPESVTVYNILFKYFSVVMMAFSIILSPFWSAFTEAYVKKDFDWMKRSYSKLNLIWFIFALISIALIFLSSWFFKLWIGEKVIIPFLGSLAMGLYMILKIRSDLYITLIAGIGKIFIQTIIDVFFALISIPLMVIMSERYNILGIILVLSMMPIAQVIIGRIQLKKILSNDANGIWNR